MSTKVAHEPNKSNITTCSGPTKRRTAAVGIVSDILTNISFSVCYCRTSRSSSGNIICTTLQLTPTTHYGVQQKPSAPDAGEYRK